MAHDRLARIDVDDAEDTKPALSPYERSAAGSPPLREVSPGEQEVAITLTPNRDQGPLSASKRQARAGRTGRGRTSKAGTAGKGQGQGVPPTPTPGRFPPRNEADERQCTNCGEVDTPQWRGTLCNACALWRRARGSDRPLPLKFPVRRRARSVSVSVSRTVSSEVGLARMATVELGEEVEVEVDGNVDVEMHEEVEMEEGRIGDVEGGYPSTRTDEAAPTRPAQDRRMVDDPIWRRQYPPSPPAPYPRPISRQASYPGVRQPLANPSAPLSAGPPRATSCRPASTPASPRRAPRAYDTPHSATREMEAMPPHMAILARAAQMISSMERGVVGDLNEGDPDIAVSHSRKRPAAVLDHDEEAHLATSGEGTRTFRVDEGVDEEDDAIAREIREPGEDRYALSPSPRADRAARGYGRYARTGARPVSITPSVSRLGRRRSSLLGLGGLGGEVPMRPLAPLPTRDEFMRSADMLYGLLERTEVAIETLVALSGRRGAGHILDGMAVGAGSHAEDGDIPADQ